MCEPMWYQGFASPYYKQSHIELRDKIRNFVEKEIKPFQDDWIKKGERYPKELHEKAYKAGIAGLLFPVEYGGTRPVDFDAFHEVVLWDELSRVGGGGALGQLSINSMALPPIIKYGPKFMKDLVLRDVIEGRKFCSLMISEPTGGCIRENKRAKLHLQHSRERRGQHPDNRPPRGRLLYRKWPEEVDHRGPHGRLLHDGGPHGWLRAGRSERDFD